MNGSILAVDRLLCLAATYSGLSQLSCSKTASRTRSGILAIGTTNLPARVALIILLLIQFTTVLSFRLYICCNAISATSCFTFRKGIMNNKIRYTFFWEDIIHLY